MLTLDREYWDPIVEPWLIVKLSHRRQHGISPCSKQEGEHDAYIVYTMANLTEHDCIENNQLH
jgi:hypothetical protein